MSAPKVQPGPFLPTLASTYQAVEKYLEYLTGYAGESPAVPPVSLQPIDVLLISLFVTYQESRANVIDLAAGPTWGASTVLGLTIPAVRSVAVLRGSEGGWRFTMSRYLRDFDQSPADLIEVKDELEAARILADWQGPLLFLTTVDGAVANLAAAVERWLAVSPRAVVLLLGIGETGTCPALAALTALCTDSPRRLVLLREQAPSLAGSGLAVVGQRAQAAFDEALFRIRRLFNDHFLYLDLVKRACLAALENGLNDDASLALHYSETGQHDGQADPPALRLLRQALDERTHELLEIRNSLTVRLATRLRRLLSFLAPPGSLRRMVTRKARAAVRRVLRGRLRTGHS